MISILARLFIKQNADDCEVREKYGVLCGAVGIVLNLLLFAAKLFAGLISGSVAIQSDAFNNLSDSGSSLITLIGFKLSSKKPDPDHPFGHGRFEYISGLIVSMFIILMGFEIGLSSVKKIILPEKPELSIVSVIILAVSILVKLYMMIYNVRIGKKIGSAAIRSAGIDSLSDCVATLAVLVCTVVSPYTDLNLDAWCGVAVSVFILVAGVKSAVDTVNPLLGTPPEPIFVDGIEKTVLSYNGIIGVHDLIVHNYGPGRVMISLHAEVSADMDMIAAHDMIDNIEEELSLKMGCMATIHMDPVDTADEFNLSLKEKLVGITSEIDSRISLHDFRVVRGETHTNLIFDVVIPYECSISDTDAVESIKKAVTKLNSTYNCVIKVDRPYNSK